MLESKSLNQLITHMHHHRWLPSRAGIKSYFVVQSNLGSAVALAWDPDSALWIYTYKNPEDDDIEVTVVLSLNSKPTQ